MTFVVTGAAGFIGCNLVKSLNQRGQDRIIAVDDLSQGEKFLNLRDLRICDYLDKSEFYARFEHGDFADVRVVFRQGACSDTTVCDGRYMMQENFTCSHRLLQSCQARGVRLIYASSAAVYGDSDTFVEHPDCERPLNVYGYSKLLFDQVVRQTLVTRSATDLPQVAGLRYFNVYGPHEQHKGRMASVAYHHFRQFLSQGKVKLFGEYGGYGPGQQMRDFVFVEDVVAQNLFLLDHPEVRGVFNAGTGCAEPFNEIAVNVVNRCRQAKGQPALPLPELVGQGLIDYIAFPDDLRGRYQCHTQADMRSIRLHGFSLHSHSVAMGVGKYVEFLLRQQQAL